MPILKRSDNLTRAGGNFILACRGVEKEKAPEVGDEGLVKYPGPLRIHKSEVGKEPTEKTVWDRATKAQLGLDQGPSLEEVLEAIKYLPGTTGYQGIKEAIRDLFAKYPQKPAPEVKEGLVKNRYRVCEPNRSWGTHIGFCECREFNAFEEGAKAQQTFDQQVPNLEQVMKIITSEMEKLPQADHSIPVWNLIRESLTDLFAKYPRIAPVH